MSTNAKQRITLTDLKEPQQLRELNRQLEWIWRELLGGLGYQAFDDGVRRIIEGKASGDSVQELTTLFQQTQKEILLKASKSELDALGNRVTTAESEIQQTPEKIRLAVEGVQVGGRNLLSNSGFTNGTACWSTLAGTMVVAEQDRRQVLRYTADDTTNDYHYIGIDKVNIKDEDVGSTATFSCWVYTEEAVELLLYHHLFGTDKEAIPAAVGWRKVAYTGRIDRADMRVGIRFKASSGLEGKIFCMWHPKFELGNKATDWTPAPEDVEGALDGLGDRVTRAEASIEVQAGQIELKASQESVNDLSGKVTENQTAIKQNADAIELKADKTEVKKVSDEMGNLSEQVTQQGTQITQNSEAIELKAEKTELDALGNRVTTAESTIKQTPEKIRLAVENIQVGGRNLLLDSAFANGTTNWRGEHGTLSVVTVDGRTCLKYTGTADTSNRDTFQILSGFSVGDTVTYSVWVKTDQAIEISCGIAEFDAQNTWLGESWGERTTFAGWKKFTHTRTLTEQDTAKISTALRIRTTGSLNNLYIWHPKLEMGNKATDWTPAPEDPANAVNAGGVVEVNQEGVFLTGGEIDLRTGDGSQFVHISDTAVTASSIYAPNLIYRYTGPDHIYVNQNATSEQIEAGTHYRSLQDALAALSGKMIMIDMIYITLETDSVGDVSFAGALGSSYIDINGGKHVLYGSVRIAHTMMPVNLYDLTIYGTMKLICTNVAMTDVKLDVGNMFVGISNERSRVKFTSGEISGANMMTAFRVDDGTLTGMNVTGAGTFAVIGAHSVVIWSGKRPTGNLNFANCLTKVEGETDAATTVPAAPASGSQEFPMTNSDTYGKSWNYDTGSGSQDDIYQGYISNAGRLYGCMWFDAASIKSTLTGKTPKAITLRLSMYGNVGRGTSVKVELYGTANTYANKGNPPALTKAYGCIGSTQPGQTQTITLPIQVAKDFQSGAISGLILYSSDTQGYNNVAWSKNYAKFRGQSTGGPDTKPLLTVTW